MAEGGGADILPGEGSAADGLDAALAQMTGLWLMGGAASDAASGPWRDALGGEEPSSAAPGGDEAELRLLALAGAFQQTARRPAAPTDLAFRPLLPALDRPSLPDAVRPEFRRLAARFSRDAGAMTLLLRFLETEGFAAHPVDWLPEPGAEWTPDLYQPWRNWVETRETDAPETLTAETWDAFSPAGRLIALRRLRRSEPATAAALMAEKLPGEPAEQRAKLLDALGDAPREDEAPLLRALVKDRSTRVKAKAAALLWRFNAAEIAEHDAALAPPRDAARALAEYFTVGRPNWIDRRRRVSRVGAPDATERRKRAVLFAQADLGAFAEAMGLSAGELIDFWSIGVDEFADRGLLEMTTRSGGAEMAAALFNRLLELSLPPVEGLTTLADRAPGDQRVALLANAARQPGLDLLALAAIGGPAARLEDADDFWRSAAMRAFQERLAACLSAPRRDAVREGRLDNELLRLGLLLTPSAAREMTGLLCGAGLHPSDPRLAALRLNAALSGATPKPENER